jgi:hypothetical protein
VGEHRQELNKQMDEVTTNHDQLQQTIAEQEAQPNCHPLMKKIDEWEEQSINKIHQAADNAREQLLTIIDRYKTQVKNDLAYLTTELSKARNEDDYVETDLKEWTKRLDKLKIDLIAAETIDFSEDNDEISLISKFFIHDKLTDIFHQKAGNIQILEGGRVVVHGPVNGITAAYCRGEYSSGRYRIHLKIEQLSSNNGFSCGIVSKNISINSIFNTQANYMAYGGCYVGSGIYQRLNHNVIVCFNDQNYNFQTNRTYQV